MRAVAIQQAAQEVMDGTWDEHSAFDPSQAEADTSHNTNFNEVIANCATQLLGGALGEYQERLIQPHSDHLGYSPSPICKQTTPKPVKEF